MGSLDKKIQTSPIDKAIISDEKDKTRVLKTNELLQLILIELKKANGEIR